MEDTVREASVMTAQRRKRINKLKKIIVTGLFGTMITFAIVIVLLSFKVISLSRQLSDLKSFVVGDSFSVTNNVTLDSSQNQDINQLAYDESLSDDDFDAMINSYEGARKICLTFDDGPSVYTDDILDILDEYGVKATFFVNGHDGFDDQYRRIVDEGHTIAMHSYSHSYGQVYANIDSFAEDYNSIHSYIEDVTGVDSVYYRFPGGSSNTAGAMDMAECAQYLESQGVVYFDWNVSAQDATSTMRSVDDIVESILGGIKQTSSDTVVVLMHDSQDRRTTVEALPIILEKLVDLDDVAIVPITEDIRPIQHISFN